jgi:hypothetical protein
MQAERGSRQTEAGIAAVDGVAACFGARATKSTFLWLILCVVMGFWISSEGAAAYGPERAGAYVARSSASIAGLGIANGRRLTNGWAESFPLSKAVLAGSDRILDDAGVSLFVSGLSPYLLRGLPQHPGNHARLREDEEYPLAGKQHQFPSHLEFTAWLFFCGFVSWGGAVLLDRP